MTFPSTIKKTGPITISKTGSGSASKTALGSPRSPGSPLNAPAKLISGSPVKAPSTNKTNDKPNVMSASTSVKKQSVLPKTPTSKTIAKPIMSVEPELKKTVTSSTANEATKAITKPPPLKLSIKTAETKEMPSPATPTKSVTKTSTTPFVKSVTKSPVVTKSISTAKSSSVPTAGIKSPVTKSSQVVGAKSSSPTIKTLVSNASKTTLSSPVAECSTTSAVSRSSTGASTILKSPSKPSTPTIKSATSKLTIKNSPTTVKSNATKDQTTAVKPTTPVKKALLPVKNTVVKPPTTPTSKSSVLSRSPSTVSSVKSISLKTPTSPSKSLTKESSSMKVSSPLKLPATSKGSVLKSGPPIPKILLKKESSTLSTMSVKSNSSTKSTTSAVSKTTALVKPNVSTSLSSKNVVFKSPVAKTQLSAVSKTPSSPTLKAPLSPLVKTSSSPSVKARTPSLSAVKPPLSPAVRKMAPVKLILSPGPSKTKSLSSSRLNSVSTESLVSRTSLKSPMSPRSLKVVPKSPSKVVKKTEAPVSKGIRGGQPVKKTINIPGITELSSDLVFKEHETYSIECKTENDLNDEIESSITQAPRLEPNTLQFEELYVPKTIPYVNDNLNVANELVEEVTSLNLTISPNVDQSSNVLESSLEPIKETSVEPSINLVVGQKHDEDDVSDSQDFVVVKMNECIPQLSFISQSDNCDITFDDNHFDTSNKNVNIEQCKEVQSCTIDMEDHFEPMNDKLVLGDVPFETDSSQSDISDNDQIVQNEQIDTKSCGVEHMNCVDDVFLFTEELSSNDLDRADSTENFIHQFMPKSVEKPEGTSSISTDDESILSRKSYSEVVSGSPKDGEYYFDYDFEIIDDCLDDDEDEKSIFVEVTEKEFPELKPKDLSGKRRRYRKQKKRSFRAESTGKYN